MTFNIENIRNQLILTDILRKNILVILGNEFNNGNILFSSNDGILDDNNLYWDNINKRLGIGTTTPTEKLDVNGNILSTGTIITGDHGTDSTDEVVNVCYGTGNPPTASTTTEGALFVKYTA